MAINKNKVITNAQKLAQKGLFDRAIKEYMSIVEDDPSDVRTWLKIGDLYTRQNAISKAIETYGKVADTYVGKGFHLKAVAVYKQMLTIDPSRIETCRALATAYVKLNQTQEALAQFKLIVGACEREGRHAESLETLQTMVEIAPNHEANRIRLAEAYARQGENAEAVVEFRLVLDALRGDGRVDDFTKVAERLLYLYPDEIDISRQLAEAYLRKQDPAKALGWLQKLFQHDPVNTETLELLGRALTEINKVGKAVAVYRELARIYGEEDKESRRLKAYERLLQLAPQDPEALKALDSSDDDVDITASTANWSIPGQKEESDRESRLSDSERVALYVSDVDLLLKYSLPEHARVRALKALSVDKDNEEALLRLKQLAMDAKNTDEAVDALMRLAKIARDGDPNKARAHLREILRLRPGHAEAKTAMSEIGSISVAPEPEEPIAAPRVQRARPEPVRRSVSSTTIAPPAPAPVMDVPDPTPEPASDDPDATMMGDEDDLNFDDLDLDLDIDFSDLEDDLDLDDEPATQRQPALQVDATDEAAVISQITESSLGFELDMNAMEPAPDDDEFGDLLADIPDDEPENNITGTRDSSNAVLAPVSTQDDFEAISLGAGPDTTLESADMGSMGSTMGGMAPDAELLKIAQGGYRNEADTDKANPLDEPLDSMDSFSVNIEIQTGDESQDLGDSISGWTIETDDLLDLADLEGILSKDDGLDDVPSDDDDDDSGDKNKG